MPLNIRSEETEELANALAKLTGETKTQAVTQALRDGSSVCVARVQSDDWLTSWMRLPCTALPCPYAIVEAQMKSWATTKMGCRADGAGHVGRRGNPPG
jgi:hypothetical protein